MIHAPLFWLFWFWFFVLLQSLWVSVQRSHISTTHGVWGIGGLFRAGCLAGGMLVALYLPWFKELWQGMPCNVHAYHNHHNGILHQSTIGPLSGWLGGWLFFSITAWFLILYAYAGPLWQWIRTELALHRLINMMEHSTHTAEDHRYEQIWKESDMAHLFKGRIILVPGCWAGLVGVIHPVLLLGRELILSLSTEELRALVLHEEAHRQRRDPWRRLWMATLTRMIPWKGKELFSRWSRAVELRCDQTAAYAISDPLIVALALIRTQRLQTQSPCAHHTAGLTGISNGLCFTHGDHLEERIQSLLQMELTASSPVEEQKQTWYVFGCIVVFLLFHEPIHQFVESLLTRLLNL